MSSALTSLPDLVSEVANLLQVTDDPIRAAQRVARFTGQPDGFADLKTSYTVLHSLFQWLLNNDRYALAARLLWPAQQFSAEPHATTLVFETLRDSQSYMLMGAASMSKSFAAGVWHLLDWLRDPAYTTVFLVGPGEQHLEQNLFSHLVRMHRQAAIPLPGVIGELFIGLDPRDRRGSISGVIIPPGRRGGKLQGTKRTPRDGAPHPIFGPLSRVRVFLDEFEKIPDGVWKDVDNIFSNLGGDTHGFKIGGAFNPENQTGACGIRCEPRVGWEGIDKDVDEKWKSTRGWDVCRLNAMRSENVVTGKEVFAGLQTREGVDKIVENAGGWNAPGVYTMVFALFPPQGAVSTVITPDLLSGAKREFLWVGRPEPVAGVDLALEGGDSAVFAAGRCGMALGYREGETVTKFEQGPRPAALLETLVKLPKAQTVGMADSIMSLATSLSITPPWLLLDRTGNGAGVHDVIRSKPGWELVGGLNFSSSPTETRILAEDQHTPRELYDRVNTELWYAMRKWLESGCFKFLPGLDTDKLVRELTSRQVQTETDVKKRVRVETKKAFKDREGKSPDEADAVSLFLHAVRTVGDYTPGFSPTAEQSQRANPDGDSTKWHCDAYEALDVL
jgi:hypothetical protein